MLKWEERVMAQTLGSRDEETAPDPVDGIRENGAGAPERWEAVLRRELAAERDRWFLWLPVAFGAGVAVYFGLPVEPPAWIGLAVLGLAMVLGLLGRRYSAAVIVALALGAAAAGFAAAQLRTASVAAPVLEKRVGPVEVVAQVRAAPPRSAGSRVVLQAPRIAGQPAETAPARIRVRLTKGETAELRPGGWVRLRAILQPPPRPAAPGAFDFGRQAYFHRIGAVGFAVSRVTLLDAPPGGPGPPQGMIAAGLQAWHLAWARLRQAVAGRVLDALPGAPGGLAAALMTGDRGAIPEEVTAAMRDSGLAHLLAISGLHMGLVGGLLFFGLRAAFALVPAIALRRPIKKWAAVAAALGCFFYLLLVGATVPSQRAFVMVLLVLLAVLLDRTALSLRLVAWAAIAVLLMAPEGLLSAGFQMSFAAVTALVAAYELVTERGWLRRSGRTSDGGRSWLAWAGLYIAGVVFTSVVAMLATGPFAAFHFNRVVWFGLAANVLAVPLTALWIMPWALLAFMLMPLDLEGLALAPMGLGIEAVVAVAGRVAGWPGAASPVAAMPPAGLAAIVLGGLWLCLWRRPWRLAGLLPLAGGFLALGLSQPPDVLVGGDGRLLGVWDRNGGLWVSSGKRGRYTAETWARRAGVSEPRAWPRDGPAADGRLTCDLLGCIYRADGQVVALVEDSRALADDCAQATVVVSLEPVRRGICPGPEVVIDRFSVWRSGAHAVWLSPEGARVESVAGIRGRRPWTGPVREKRWE
jgi:competence protein ComEC